MTGFDLIQSIFCRIGYGILALDAHGRVVHLNDISRDILKDFDLPRANGGESERWRHALKSVLRAGGTARFRLDQNDWVVVRRTFEQPSVLHAIPLSNEGPDDIHTIVVLVDLRKTSAPRSETLQRIFSFTPAEASLAADIASGRSLDELALARGVTLGTLRKQLTSIFAKTGTGRQAELVAIVSRASVLP